MEATFQPFQFPTTPPPAPINCWVNGFLQSRSGHFIPHSALAVILGPQSLLEPSVLDKGGLSQNDDHDPPAPMWQEIKAHLRGFLSGLNELVHAN